MDSNTTRQFPPMVPTVLAGTIEFESGYPFENVEGLNEHLDLICGVCHMLPKNPIETYRCSHIFCKACIQKATGVANPNYTSNAICPMCRSSFQVISNILYRITNTALTNLYNSLVIKCSLCSLYKAGLKDLDHHEVFECPARPIQCPNTDCTVILPADELITTHFQTCKYYSKNCEKCHLPVRISEFNTHDCKHRLWDALYKFQMFFNKNRKEAPPLSKLGVGGTTHYHIHLINREGFLAKYKDEYIECKMIDDETPLNIIRKGNVIQIEGHNPPSSFL